MFYLAKSQLNRQVDEILFDYNHEEIDSSWTICDFFRDMSADDNFVQYYRRIERALQRVMYYSLVPVAVIVFIAAFFAELWLPWGIYLMLSIIFSECFILTISFWPLLCIMRTNYRDAFVQYRKTLFLQIICFYMFYAIQSMYTWSLLNTKYNQK